MHFLLVEDNPDLAANVVDFLEDRGHSLDTAYNGFAGLGFALENNYDALILDLMLPGIDGFEVCERLRAAGRAVPVLMLTARDGLEDKLEGFASWHGADFYGLPRNTGRITLRRQDWTLPGSLPFGAAELKPLGGGETLHWQLMDEAAA